MTTDMTDQTNMRTVTYDADATPSVRIGPNTTHGFCRKSNPEKISIYRIWIDMVRRCHDPRRLAFKWYGAKGISVCQRWRESFESFYADMGDRPEEMSLDRIDTKGNYEPSNCRWATQIQQQRNRSNNKLTESTAAELRALRKLGAKSKELAEKFGISERMVRAVINGDRWA